MNTIFRMRNLFSILILTLFINTISSVASEVEYPRLRMHGEIYESSCSYKQKEILREQILKNILYDANMAWRNVEIVLCAPNSQNNRGRIKSIFQKRVREKIESTAGETIFKSVKVDDELLRSVMALGNAWDANLIFERGEIILQYFSNEACVKSARFSRGRAGWAIYEIGETCD